MAGAIILQIVLIFLNAVFASAEIAVISANENKIAKMADSGDKRAKRLHSLKSQPSKFLSTIQVTISLAGLLGSAFAADNFAGPLAEALYNAGLSISLSTLKTICLVVVTLILAYFNIVFGELIPKRLAMRRADGMALGMSGMLKVVSVIFAPLVWLLTVSTNGILRLFGMKPGDDEDTPTAEEILLLAEAGSAKGSIEVRENELIRNVFEFTKTDVSEVCTHRKDTDILYMDDDEEEWDRIVRETRHTYYPVCGKDADDVLGMLSTKKYFRLDDRSRQSVMENAVEPAMFVAGSMQADALFDKMKSSRCYVAIVVDEYGGMRGIITIRDLIELIMGDLNEQDEKAEYTIEKIDDDTWEITGLAPIDEVEKALGIKIPPQETEDYEIFGGYVAGLLGAIPADGTTARTETPLMRIEVLSVVDHRIEKVRVTVKEEEDGKTD